MAMRDFPDGYDADDDPESGIYKFSENDAEMMYKYDAEDTTEFNSTDSYGNKKIYSITPDDLVKWKKQKIDKQCKYVYQRLFSPECQSLPRNSSLFERPVWEVVESVPAYLSDSSAIVKWPNLPHFFSNSTNYSDNTYESSRNSSTYDEEFALPPFELWQTILIAIALGLCIILTVGGNILVLLAFIVDRTIRQPSNYFIASLAATDILIGTVSLPFYTVYVLKTQWHLGPILCDLWLSVDYTVCLVSQYTVLLITIDRFCSVKIAAKYRSWRTKNRVIWMVTITWTIPALLFFIMIFGWEYFKGYRDLVPGECAVPFLKDPVINTALIIGYYWTTLVVILVLYGGIYKTAYEMQKKSEAKQRKMQSMVALSAGAMAGMAGRTSGIGMSKTQSTLLSQDKPKPAQIGEKTDATGGSDTSSRKTSLYKVTTTATAEDQSDQPAEKKPADCASETEKYERSSSPAFESDEESNAAVPAVLEVNKKKTVSKNQVAGKKGDRESAAAGHVTSDNIQCDNQETPPKKTPTPEKAPACPAIHVSNSVSSTEVPEKTPEQEVMGSSTNSIIPPPAQFRNSPSASTGDAPASATSSNPSSRPRSLFLHPQQTYDILMGMDNSDLKYMDDSSVILPSPGNESSNEAGPPSPTHCPGSSNSLLQAALIRAAAQQNRFPDPLKKEVRAPNPKLDSTVSLSENSTSQVVTALVKPSASLVELTREEPKSKPETGNSFAIFNSVSKSNDSEARKSDSSSSKKDFVKSFGKRLKRRRRRENGVKGADRQKSKSENRARKAFRTISFILGAFVACWTPYHVIALVEGFCSDPPCTSTRLYMFSYFLCYANSPMNPFCYALANKQFKKTFTRILKGDLHLT